MLQNLFQRFSLNQEDAAPVSTAKNTKKAHEALRGLAARTTSQEDLFAAIAKFRDQSANLQAIDILSGRMPKFMYFSHYDRMSGELSINKLNSNKANGVKIDSGDQVFLDFLEYAGTNLGFGGDDAIRRAECQMRGRSAQDYRPDFRILDPE